MFLSYLLDLYFVFFYCHSHQLVCPGQPPEGNPLQTSAIQSLITFPIILCPDSSVLITFSCCSLALFTQSFSAESCISVFGFLMFMVSVLPFACVLTSCLFWDYICGLTAFGSSTFASPSSFVTRLRQHGSSSTLCPPSSTRSFEDLIQDFISIPHFTDLLDFALIDFFCYGLNNPLQSTLIRDGPRGLLSVFLDYALQLTRSSFTIGEVEEDSSPKHFLWGAVSTKLRWPELGPPQSPSMSSSDGR